MQSDRALKNWYNFINKKFFNNELPSNVCVRWVNEDDIDEEERCEEKYYGWADCGEGRHKYVIVLSRVKNPGEVAKLATLCHEMCHIATGLKDDHGPAFSEWHELLTSRGLFRKGALLKHRTLF
jgi:SprT-like family